MARTPSTMLDLGTPAPEFALTEPRTGKTVALSDFANQPLLVAFICNHCPFVLHIQDAWIEFARDYGARGLAVVAINSNDTTTHPDDAPEKMATRAVEKNYSFPYLFDPTQAVAKAYRAACTPDFFLFDRAGKLAYRGQFDSARPGNDAPNDGADLRAAADAVLVGKTPAADQKPSLGCNIKWTAGNEPDYFA
ncbi:MAG: thioredoxin family protein [Thiotrichales bacterium]